MRFIRSILLSVLICSGVLSQSLNKDELIITKEDLEVYSVKRLGDIFTLLPQLDIYTIDGYRYYLMDGSLFENTPNSMVILINGVRTDFNNLGYVNINQFPIDMELIDKIVLTQNPSVYNGEYSSGIIIDIITRNMHKDISILFTRSTGNEIGDPGPYLFTEYASPNVDEVGPNTYLTTSYGSKSFNTALGFMSQVAPTTDPAILKRTNNFILQNYIVNYSSVFGYGSLKTDNGKYNLFSAYSQSGQPYVGSIYGADLIFLDELSIELPFQSNNFLITSGNKISLSATDGIQFDLNLNYSTADQSMLSNDLLFNSDDIIGYAKIAFNSSIGNFNYLLGSSFEYQKLSSSYNNFNVNRTLPAIFASSDFHSIENLKHSVDLIFQFDKSNSGFFINLGSNLKLNSSDNLILSLYGGNLFNNVYTPAFRISNGMENQVQFYTDSLSQNNDAFVGSLNFEYSHKPTSNFSFNTGINLTNESNLNFVLRDFSFNDSTKTINNNQNEIYESVQGSSGEFFIGLFIRLFNSLDQKFYYRYKNFLAGDEIYKSVLERFPKNKFFYSLVYTPYKDLNGSLNLTYTTSQDWIEYRNISIENDDVYTNKIDNRLLLNVAITKGFWKNRILLSALFENLLNERIQYHPVGSTTDLTFYLKLKVLLESVIAF